MLDGFLCKSIVIWICRIVKCVEVNKEARAVFERSLARLPASVNSEISWHCADVSVVSTHTLQSHLARAIKYFHDIFQ